ncbi:SLC13 family permease [Sinisalibacter aestuarii]|nr:SLC13 family permease [Sinisalibacter aestuarii]
MTAPSSPATRSHDRRRLAKIAGLALVTGATALAAFTAMEPRMAATAVLTVVCIGLWATALVPEYWTGFAFFLAAMLLHLAPAEVVFSGFHSSTFWLLFSGLVLGAAIKHTGLGKRSAALLARMLGRRYWQVIAGIVLFGVGLAFIMPSSMGRVVMLVPIIIALADHMGYGPDDKGRIGMLMAGAFGTFAPAFTILPANVPNMILTGMAEAQYGQHLSYFTYMLLHFPVLGALKAGVVVGLILWLFPDRDPAPVPADDRAATPMNASERRLIALLALALLLWFTDALHGMSPAWVGLGAALYALWPGSGLTSKTVLNEDISYGPLFFIAAIMGLGAVSSATGLGETLVAMMSEQAGFATDRPVGNVVGLALISTLVATVTNLPSVPAIMTPLAGELAVATGLPLATVLMTQVLAFSNVLLPHQAPPLVMATQVAKLPSGALLRMTLSLFALTLLVLTPLDLVWWHVLGLL